MEYPGGEVWASGHFITGRNHRTLIYSADLDLMEFETMTGKMKFAEPDMMFARNAIREHGSISDFFETLCDFPFTGHFDAMRLRPVSKPMYNPRLLPVVIDESNSIRYIHDYAPL